MQLLVGRTDTQEYGYLSTLKRFTGLRTKFTLLNLDSDLELVATGWDIDFDDETEVFLNSQSIGYLTKGPQNNYAEETRILIRKNSLVIGNNHIEFVQRKPDSAFSGLDDEKWAVKDITVNFARPDIVGEQAILQDKVLKPNVPFSGKATLRNNGTGSAPETTLRFYLSIDESISASDTQLASMPFDALTEQRTRTVLQQLQTSFVNSDRYIGFCLDAAQGETSLANNCSAGVPLKSLSNVAPIIMLLLDD